MALRISMGVHLVDRRTKGKLEWENKTVQPEVSRTIENSMEYQEKRSCSSTQRWQRSGYGWCGCHLGCSCWSKRWVVRHQELSSSGKGEKGDTVHVLNKRWDSVETGKSQHKTLNKGMLHRQDAFTQGFWLAKDSNLVLEKEIMSFKYWLLISTLTLPNTL